MHKPSSLFDCLIPDFALMTTSFLGIFRDLRQFWSTMVVETIFTCAKASHAVKTRLVTNTVVLLAWILPTVAPLSFEWFFKHFPLSFTCRDSLLRIIILTVLTLTDVLVTCLGASEAYTVHLLALALGTSALLSRFSLDTFKTILSCFRRRASRRRLIMGLENLSHLLIHI